MPGPGTSSPLYSFNVAVFDYDDYASVQQVPLVLDGTKAFSIAGWIQPLAEGEMMPLVTASPRLTIGLDRAQTGSGVVLYAALGGTVAYANALPMSLGRWHYVAMTYAPGGTMTLYVDGAQGGASHVSGVPSGPFDGTFIIGSNAYCRCLTMSFWSIALTAAQCAPQWTVPSPAPGLEAACDFATIPARDVSGHNRGVSYSDTMNVAAVCPSLELTGTADYVAPDPADGLSPGGSNAPFTLQAWVYANAPVPSWELAPAMTLIANGDISGSAGLSAYLAPDSASGKYRWCVQLGGSHGPAPVVATTEVPPQEWHNLAVTFDGASTLTMYVDGTACGTGTVASIAPLPAPRLMFGAAPDSSAPGGASHHLIGRLQALSIWSTALPAASIAANMTTEPDPASAGLAGYFDLATESPVNRVTDAAAALFGAGAISELVLETSAPFGGNGAGQVAPAERTMAVDGPILRAPSEAWLARFDAAPAATVPGLDIDGLIAEYRELLRDAPGPLRETLEELFSTNLRRGAAAAAAGERLPGTVTFANEGDQVVFTVHTEEGAMEVHRADAASLDQCTAWLVSVLASIVGCIFTALGASYSVGTITQKFLPKFIQENAAGRAAVLQAILQEPLSAMTFIRVIRTFAAAGSLTTVITAGLAGVSWWKWAWTVASITLQIISLWASGGWFLLVILAQLALSLAQLGVLIGEKPASCYTALPQATALRAPALPAPTMA